MQRTFFTMHTPPLKIYRASAGSGKTFTLAVEYITLLVIDQSAYQHILAVTFTNKATAEMKSRILETLEGLRDSKESAENYFHKIKEAPEIKALNISDEEIRRRCGVALHLLSHDYSRFHIETIDSFFISVIKDLARELNLPANLNIDLNSDDVLSEAVDNIIDYTDEASKTFQSLTSFIMEKIDDDKNWKMDEEIKTFSRNIFNEKYLKDYNLLKGKIDDKQFMQNYKRLLLDIKTKAVNELQSQGEQFIQLCTNHGFNVDDFKQKKSGVYGFFQKLAMGKEIPNVNSYVEKCRDNVEEWNKENKALQNLAETTLIPLLNKTIDMLPQATKTISTVNVISKHLNHLQLLAAVSNEIDQLNLDSNRFLLANSAYFLQRMINKSSVPFIYEKSGSRFSHIMIDEFQDTSDLQWSNFLPLLNNCLDYGQSCLVVGDVKQSIYRFRNSDWNILNTLDINPELDGKINIPDPLNTNRRSMGNVINFNNSFFKSAISVLNEDYKQTHDEKDCADLIKAYSDVEQKIVEKNEELGYVCVEVVENEDDTTEGYELATLQLLLERINDLLDKGLEQKDITILLRFNKYIPLISQYFSENAPELKIISDEAYRLSASSSINIIISALRYLIDPDDKLTLVNLVANTTDLQYSRLLLFNMEELKKLLPDDFKNNIDTLPYMPIKDLVETIYDTFQLDKTTDQDAFLFYFHDQITAFLEDKHNDINSFLAYWDDTLSQKTIPSGNTIDGIRIMSVHKSKGLEFHTVIIPFCDWSTTGKPTDLLWCNPTENPYNGIPLVPVNYTKEMQASIFRTDYDEETLRNNVDNLNLLYVAFTRAKNNLFIFTSEQKKSTGKEKEDTINDISKLIHKVLFKSATETPHYETGALITTPSKAEKSNTENIKFSTSTQLPVFRQSNKSKDFVAEEEEKTPYIDKGLLYHSVLQDIFTIDDIDKVINEKYSEGVFKDKAEKEQVEKDIKEAMSNPTASQWFDKKWEVINERTILKPIKGSSEWKEHRADRVISSPEETICIDFKTGAYNKEHFYQVKEYMELLVSIGYPNVKGYVWYVLNNRIEKV